MRLPEQYYEETVRILDKAVKTQASTIQEAAEKLAASLAAGQVCHVFGSGHSAMIAREVFGRAGGLVPVNQIQDPDEGLAERVEGYGTALFDAYRRAYGFEAGEVLIVISNSGINPAPIEIAQAGSEAGGIVVSITNVAQSRASQSRHSSGKRLFEVSDIVIDNGCVAGDAAVYVEKLGERVGPTSTLAGAMLINLLMVATVEKMIVAGQRPPVLRSQNLPGTDEWNEKLKERYRGRIAEPGI